MWNVKILLIYGYVLKIIIFPYETWHNTKKRNLSCSKDFEIM